MDLNPDSRFLVPITPLLILIFSTSTITLALQPPGAFYDQLDSNLDSDSKHFNSDSDSRKKGWMQIQLDSVSKCLESNSDSTCPDSHITSGSDTMP